MEGTGDGQRANDGLHFFLRSLFGLDPGAFVEVAHRREHQGKKGPMHRGRTGIFLPASQLEKVAGEVVRIARTDHVWVGVVPRRPHPQTGEIGGTKAHAAPARVLWVDCDAKGAAPSLERLVSFRPQPHMVVASGGGYHAYWLLRDAIHAPEEVRAANVRLAEMLGGDPQASDVARLLRPPGTLNYKTQYGSPQPVSLVFAGHHPRYGAAELLPRSPRKHAPRRPHSRAGPVRGPDPLQRIPPAVYFKDLAGVEPDRAGKVCCPLPDHDDPEPSCHVYEAPAQGWYCYGCGRGGDIYELAGLLWGLRRCGRDFVQLRSLLERRFKLERWRRRRPRRAEAVRR